MLHTTGTLAKSVSVCDKEYRKVARALGGSRAYGKDRPIPLSIVLEHTSLESAVWALRCVIPGEEAERDKFARLFACECAERVLKLFEADRPGDDRPRKAIETARRFANGQATWEERASAHAAARGAAWGTRDAAYAARGASWDTRDAACAASAASWAAAYAASVAAWAAAWAAAWDIAWDAASAATRAAAYAAAYAASVATGASSVAARATACVTERQEQTAIFLRLLNETVSPIVVNPTELEPINNSENQ